MESPLTRCNQAIRAAITEIAEMLRNTPVTKLTTSNKFGDEQLDIDVKGDEIVEKHLRSSGVVKWFASEERPEAHVLLETQGFAVTYDPLDGSSIVENNFAVGSIFSIWPVGTTPEFMAIGAQVDAVLAMYGPRTTLVHWNADHKRVQELTWIGGQWVLTRDALTVALGISKTYSPGNARAASDNLAYRAHILSWLDAGLTLRYSGGLVPDAYQILIKGEGIFANVASKKHKAKLRLLYEVGAVSFLIEKAGGISMTTTGISVLALECKNLDQRT